MTLVDITHHEPADPSGLMNPVTIAPVPFLVDLRRQVLSSAPINKRKGSALRTPKNRIKIADDFGIQIQAKDSGNETLWECIAVQGECLTADDFDERKRRGKGRVVFGFSIRQSGESWRIKPGMATLSSEGHALKARVIAELTPDFLTGRVALFSESCLICNHRLKDPVSRQRLIGPECWGKNNLDVRLRTREVEAGK